MKVNSFYSMKTLIQMNLSHNEIKCIDRFAFADLSRLTKILLVGNPIRTIQSKGFYGLTMLYLSACMDSI